VTDHASVLPIALEAVELASELVRTRLPSIITTKGDRDLVSEVDFAVEREVRKFLSERTPSISFLGEEEGASGDINNDLMWALDPVDGTSNLVHGLPLCAVSLGLVDRGHPVVGVIDLPFLGPRYSAVQGRGAYAGGVRRLHTSRTSRLEEAIVAMGDYAVGTRASERNRLRFAITEALASQVERIRMFGSAVIDLAWVAEGKLDASIMLSNKPWDTAAGVLLAREAGARVLDCSGVEHDASSTATIAATASLTDAVLQLIQRVTDRSNNPSLSHGGNPNDPTHG
jgi:myo-inositol-1(or 4)-monophosphatase